MIVHIDEFVGLVMASLSDFDITPVTFELKVDDLGRVGFGNNNQEITFTVSPKVGDVPSDNSNT